MIELHCHCLPYVDDGAADMQAALAMLNQYESQGVTDIVCTPHVEPEHMRDKITLEKRFAQIRQQRHRLQMEADDRGMKVRLHAGCELILCPDLIQQLPEFGREMALADSTYLLVELPRWFSGGLQMLDHLLFAIQMAGFMPILAHPERSMGESEVFNQLKSWVEQDKLLLQVNASSYIQDPAWSPDRARRYGKRQSYVHQLLENNLVSFFASDAHNPDKRPPYNRLVYDKIKDMYNEEMAKCLTTDNPLQVLQDGLIEKWR